MLDQPAQKTGTWARQPGFWIVAALAAILGGIFAYNRLHSSSHAPDPAQLATKIGALDCSAESYYLIARLDHTKTPLYACDMGRKTICVVEENGIAENVTVEARILFANALGGQKPSCLSGT